MDIVNDWFDTKNILTLTGAITLEKTSNIASKMLEFQIKSELKETTKEPLALLINSGGGDIISALKLCDVIKYVIKKPVKGIVVGSCHSAATLVLLSCEIKVCLPHSDFLLHSNSVARVTASTEEELGQLREDLILTRKTMLSYYEKTLKLDVVEIEKLMNKGDQTFNRYISPTEALSIGLVDVIQHENINIF
ncbi:MAG: ATP-dependent Clp protease proteolytic subunit [Candidatus Paceibacterota bacterium]